MEPGSGCHSPNLHCLSWPRRLPHAERWVNTAPTGLSATLTSKCSCTCRTSSGLNQEWPQLKGHQVGRGCPSPGASPSPGPLTHAGQAVLSPAMGAEVVVHGPAGLGEWAGLLVCLQPAGQRRLVGHAWPRNPCLGLRKPHRAWGFSSPLPVPAPICSGLPDGHRVCARQEAANLRGSWGGGFGGSPHGHRRLRPVAPMP